MMHNGKNKTGMKLINWMGKLKQEWKYEQDGKEETEKKEIGWIKYETGMKEIKRMEKIKHKFKL